jgi:hypothetical protein
MASTLRHLLRTARQPVTEETHRLLAEAWALLPEHARGERQMFGRHGLSCGATIGAMPRCDFACTGCYLGEEANRIPAAPLEEVVAQLQLLRTRLGPGGSVQLTDGEVTLRPVEEVVRLLKEARALGLIPMLMTHGDSFRRRPGLLERLMEEGGLTELSIHVDTTQRGRKGWRALEKGGTREEDLHPLREELASLVREARRKTGLTLKVATTLTVEPRNLAGVPGLMRWLVRHTDAFGMVSFQPMAQVGRTEEGLGDHVTMESLWAAIGEGLGETPDAMGRLDAGSMHLGHPRCTRYVPGLVLSREGQAPVYHPVRQLDDPTDVRATNAFYARWGGVGFRDLPADEAVAKALGMFAEAPGLFLTQGPPYLAHWLRRLGGGGLGPLRLVRDLARGKAQVSGLVIISHHFMSAAQLQTAEGKERLGACVFQVAVNGELKSMCEVNALGLREKYYADLQRRLGPKTPDGAPAAEAPTSVPLPVIEDPTVAA